MRVALDGAKHVGLGTGAAEGRPHRVDLRLGVGGAAGGGHEGDGQPGPGAGVGHGEALCRAAVHRPLRRRAGGTGAGEVAQAVAGQVVALGAVEDVDAQSRRLHRERATPAAMGVPPDGELSE